MNRRIFLRNAAIAMAGIGTAPAWLARAAATADGSRRKVLVVLFQRGAADGLNIVVPHGERRYYQLRPSIAIPRDEVLDLNGTFGLHPALRPLKGIYDAKQLAIIEAVGSPDPTRSHFDAQDYMESGTPGVKSTREGWLNRALPPRTPKTSPVRAVALGPTLPRTLRGRNAAVAMGSLNEFQLRDESSSTMFESLYAGDKALSAAGRDTFEAMRMLESVRRQPYSPADGAQYPNGRLGQSLRQIAQLIKADVGLEVAFADMGGWDTHVNEVGVRPTVGPLANLLAEFGRAVGAFHRDLGSRMEDIVVVTLSEFGRTARENGNRGTDHGHANVMFVMGGGVRGGRICGDWPGLEAEQLYEGRDLALTTDFRDVLTEVVAGQLGAASTAQLFPNYRAAKRLQLLVSPL
jgi:uncharacterized protein (DUF1501 family)